MMKFSSSGMIVKRMASSPFLKASSRSLTTSNYVTLANETDLEGIIKANGNKVLYFTATWCPPCKMIAPVFKKLSEEFSQTQFVKIDIDEYGDLATDFRVNSVPTFVFIEGAKVKTQVCTLY